MRLVDYLATRVFECTVHTLDLAMAIRVDIVLPEPVATITLQLLGERARVTGQTAPFVLAATGRGPLPVGFSVL